MSSNYKKLIHPILVVEAYLTFILAFYFFGPIKWRTENISIFISFIFFVQISLFIGYKMGLKIMRNRDTRIKDKENKVKLINDQTILHYIKILLVLNLIILILYLIRNTGSAEFSFETILSNIQKGVMNSSEQYYNKFETNRSFGGRYLTPIVTLSSFFLWATIPLGLYFFKNLRLYEKLLLILNIFFELARWISTGTNKGLIDMIIIFITIYFIKSFSKTNNIFKLKKMVLSILLLIIIGFGIDYFTGNIDGRLRSDYSLLSRNINNTYIDYNNSIINALPNSFKPTIIFSDSYLTQGYYATSLAIGEEFIPMFGFGSSYFIIENIQDTFGIDIFKYTYQYRLDKKGWDMKSNWHSIYVWLANDFSFFGVIIFMLFVGIYFGIVSYRTIIYKDPIFACLFSLLILMFFYFPANNQIFQSPITFMGFWGLNFFWFFKTKINKKDIIYKLRW